MVSQPAERPERPAKEWQYLCLRETSAAAGRPVGDRTATEMELQRATVGKTRQQKFPGDICELAGGIALGSGGAPGRKTGDAGFQSNRRLGSPGVPGSGHRLVRSASSARYLPNRVDQSRVEAVAQRTRT